MILFANLFQPLVKKKFFDQDKKLRVMVTVYHNINVHLCTFEFLTDAFDSDKTLETLQKIKAAEIVEIPVYDSVNATG